MGDGVKVGATGANEATNTPTNERFLSENK